MDSNKKREILEKKHQMRKYCQMLMYRIELEDYLGAYELFEEFISAYETLQRIKEVYNESQVSD